MNIGIIGAGTMGLTIAYRLAKARHRVTVFEASPQTGGLATWVDYGNFIWDKFYHVICRADSSLLGLIDDLGITSHLRWQETRSGFLWRGRLLSMSNNWEFIKFPPLSIIDKARLALGILHVNRIQDASPLETVKATDWLRSIFGNHVYEVIWEPLLESKYGPVKESIPAMIMWATIRRYYGSRSKGGGKEKFGYLSGGFKIFYDAFARNLAAYNCQVISAAPVSLIDNSNPEHVWVVAGGAAHNFDRVISCIPTHQLRSIAPRLGELFEQDKPPRFLGVICMAMVLKRALSPYYITNLIQKGFPFTGIIETTNLTGIEEINGHHLVMLPRYDLPNSEWFDRPEETIAKEFLSNLRPIWNDIDENLIRFLIHRERYIQALWIDNPPPADQKPGITKDRRVWNVNAELAGRDTLNNNAIVGVADRVAAQFLSELSASPASARTSDEYVESLACAAGDNT